MSFHHAPFFFVQRLGFEQNIARDADLADIVQQGTQLEVTQLRAG